MESAYLKVFALDDELSVLCPLDGGLGPAVELALELDVLLLVGGGAARALDVARRHLHLQLGRHVRRVLRVLRPALVHARVRLAHRVDLQARRRHTSEPAVQIAANVTDNRRVSPLGKTIVTAIRHIDTVLGKCHADNVQYGALYYQTDWSDI